MNCSPSLSLDASGKFAAFRSQRRAKFGRDATKTAAEIDMREERRSPGLEPTVERLLAEVRTEN